MICASNAAAPPSTVAPRYPSQAQALASPRGRVLAKSSSPVAVRARRIRSNPVHLCVDAPSLVEWV